MCGEAFVPVAEIVTLPVKLGLAKGALVAVASVSPKHDCPGWMSWGILASIAASFGIKSIGQLKK